MQADLPPGQAGQVLVRTVYSGVSRGTEALVFNGEVPRSQYEAMRAPFQEGEFPGPVKYGYANVGEVLPEDAPPDLAGRTVFCLYPHQDLYRVPVAAVAPVPAGVPPARAVLAANMETAVNVVWDARPAAGDRIVVIGAGVVGLLVAWLCRQVPGAAVTAVDVNPERGSAARALGVRILEVAAQAVDIGVLEVEGRELALGTQEHVAVDRAVAVPIQVVHVVDALDVHGEAFHAVGKLDRDRIAVDPAHLLEVGELGHLHAVAPDLPAEAPGAQRRALPIVLDEADVVGVDVDAEHAQAAEILVLHVLGRGLQEHLELVVVLKPVGVLAVAAVARPAGRLHVGRAPGLRPQAAQRGRGMEGAGAHLHVVGLQDDAAALRPIGLQAKDERLERPVATVGVHRRSTIRINGRADNAPRLGSGQPRGCPAVAAGACVSGGCRRCSDAPRARAAPRPWPWRAPGRLP